MAFELYSLVRVRQLLRSDGDAYDDWGANLRPPRPGDVGTIVDVLQIAAAPDLYVVERVRDDGVTEWLSEFTADELESNDA